MLTRVASNNYVSFCNLQLFVLKMTLKRRRKSGLFEGSPERSTMEKNVTLNAKNTKKLTKLSSTSSELESSFSQQPVSLLASFTTTTSSEFVKRKTRGIFTTSWILLLTILSLISSSSSASGKPLFY